MFEIYAFSSYEQVVSLKTLMNFILFSEQSVLRNPCEGLSWQRSKFKRFLVLSPEHFLEYGYVTTGFALPICCLRKVYNEVVKMRFNMHKY